MENLIIYARSVKMPKCPECDEEIEELNFDVTASCSGQLTQDDVENEYDTDYDIDCLTENVDIDNYSCPKCNECLFDYDEEAREFLKNVTPLQKVVAEKINKMKKKNGK